MSDKLNNYGLLMRQDVKVFRNYFVELVRLLGHQCVYYAPKSQSKQLNTHGELDTDTQYYEGITVGCIFEQYPDQKSLKKSGWVTELQEGSSIIHVPYDTPHLQYGALFDIPSGLDNAAPRRFRVIGLSNISIYPASIACEIAPEFETENERHLIEDFSHEDLPLLVDVEGED